MTVLARVEDAIASFALFVMVVLPLSFALIAARVVWRPGFNALTPASDDARLKPSRSIEEVTGSAPASTQRTALAFTQRSAKALAERNLWIDRALASLGIVAGI